MDKFGNTNRFQYDARGNLIETVSADGLFTRTVYDENGRAFLTSDRNQVTGTYTEYDALGRATNTYRMKGVRIIIEPDPAKPGQFRSRQADLGTAISTNSTEYYENGWVKSRTGADRQTTYYEYYPDGQTRSVTDPLSNVTFYAYDPAGRQEYLTNALQQVTHFRYDPLGRQTMTVFHDQTWVSNRFNEVGQRIGQIDQAGLLREFRYDVAGQLTNVVMPFVPDPENPSSTNAPSWVYEYNPQGQLTVITDPKDHSTTNTYDAFGRLVSRRLPLSDKTETTRYNELGLVTNRMDFKGQFIEFRYDRYGRTTNKYYFAKDAAYPSNSVSYEYYPLGQLRRVVERSGSTASQGYVAAAGRPTGGWGDGLMAGLNKVSRHPAGGALALPLLALGMVLVPREKRRMVLDALKRAIQEHRRLPELNSRRRVRLPGYGWRAVTLVTIIALIGCDPAFNRLWTAQAQCTFPPNYSSDYERITEFAYDFDGRLEQVNCPEGVINYHYELATGRLTGTCTESSEFAYTYDKLGRLETVKVLKRNGVTLATPEVTTYTYNKVGSRETVRLPNDTLTRYQYDNLNRLTNLTHTASNGALLASYSYQLHPTGRRTNAVEILATDDSQTPWMTNTIAWSYDAMYRLTNEVTVSTSSAVAHSAAYEYDLAGNRWKRTSGTETTTYVHDDNDQLRSEVTGSSTTSYDYNRNGSLTNKTDGTGTISYAYNLANKLSSVTAGSTTHFEYNDQGIRVRSIAGYSTNYFLIDANNHTGYQQVLEEFTAASTSRTLTRSYVIGDDVLGQCGGEQTDEPRWLLYDGHGSTRQLVHGEASIQQHYNFDAYGRSLGTDLAQQTSDTSLLYCGEQFDTALQMYNLRARYYNPNNGRFNQRDTFGGNNFDPQSLHKYAYTNCDPVNGTDPNGCFTLVENLAAITILTIIVSAVVVALKAFPMPGARSRVVFPPTGGPPIHLSPGPNNSAWLAALLAVMSIVLTEAVRQSGQTEQPQPNPEPDAQGVVLQSGTAQAGEEENLKDIYFHYSQDPPASFSKGLDPPAWVTDIKYSGLDSENAMFGFGIPPPKYEYFFRIDRWTMLDPPDPSTPRRWTQYRVIRPTGAGSLVGWREVAQTHKGRQQ